MTKTYRDLFKWGDPDIEEEIDDDLEEILKDRINFTRRTLSDLPGIEEISEPITSDLDEEILTKFINTVGKENIATAQAELLDHSTGASYTDVLKIRQREFDSYPSAIVYPRDEQDIVKIIQICREYDICIIPTGGRSSVTEGISYPRTGIALDLTRHLNKIIEINENDSSVTVEPGIMGPDLEKTLNNYRSDKIPQGYTCGHFPQSFEYSTVGGWVVTRGAGQESTGYGKIEDMMLGLRMVTPNGVIEIPAYPARATGPDLMQMIVGSEGAFGIVTEVTMKIRQVPPSTRYASFLFKSWKEGIAAVRQVMQGRTGKPYIFRLSDPEESDIYLEMADLASWKEWILDKLGYKKGKRVLLMCSTAGTKRYAKSVMKDIKSIVSDHHGQYIGTSAVHEWLEDRFHTPYLRSALMDQDVIIDTLETSATWDKLPIIWQNVRSTIKDRPHTIVMVHLSHMYENGSNLYFIFMSQAHNKDQINDYKQFQNSIINSIIDAGGTLSHHHGIGRLFVPWMEEQIGTIGMELLQVIKQWLDPDNLMNPGVLGLE